MSIKHNNVEVKSIVHNGYTVKSWIHNGIEIFKTAVNKAIALLKSSYGISGDYYPYYATALIYQGIDLSLYKGVQFYVASASMGCNWNGYSTNLCVAAFASGTTVEQVISNNNSNINGNKGAVTIANASKNANGVESRSSQTGKTLTLNFTASSGTVDLFVVGYGTGANSNGIGWQLSNAILLAR